MKKGFTLIEMLIVIAILGILAAVIIPAFQGKTYNDHKCIAGYKFTRDGSRQIMSEQGKGVPCDAVTVSATPTPAPLPTGR